MMNIVSRGRRWMQSMREGANGLRRDISVLRDDLVDAKILAAKCLVGQMSADANIHKLDDVEFRVFSQFGEDGIIQYLIRRADISPELATFVEFGVEDYREANTRFLLINDNWRGLVIDAGTEKIAAVNAWPHRWKYDLTAKCAFINRDNINELIITAGFSGEIGLLSIDVDGNDYWIWENISAVDPIIVVVEYNGLFGPSRAVTVPYDPTFDYGQAHHSYVYWGCSLRALECLASRKGYALVGSNSAGNNAFFVKRDRLNAQPPLTAAQAYRESRFRISRDRGGYFNFLSRQDQLAEIAEMQLFDVERDMMVKVSDLNAE